MDSASAQPATPLESGQRIAHYQLLQRIGAGGMGVVFEAEDLKLKRRVALKFLPEEYTTDQHWRERFLREARAASALNHPGICTIHEINEDNGRIFLAMELLAGETLRERIRRKPLNEDEIASLGAQIADALAAAHAKGIIHRDLKPPNILITPDDRAKILDFGVAKSVEGVSSASPDDPTVTSATSHTLTGEGAVVGTLNYMSPEQARGEKLDARTDIFSLGATLYEMAAGQAAFRGDTVAVIHDAILNRQPEPVSKRNPKISAELERIVGKALEKDRDLRYQTATELRADLKRLQRDSSGATTLPPTPSTRSKWWRVAGSAAALLLSAAYLGHLYRNQSGAPPRVVFEPVTAFTDSASVPAISPDGHAIAFLRGESELAASSRRDVQVFFKSLPDGQPMRLADLAAWQNWPEFSPDGTRIAFTTLERGYAWNVWQASVYGGQPSRMLANAEGLTWIDNDHILFSEIDRVGSFHMQVVTSRANRTEQRVVYSPPETGMAHYSRLSPDRKWVLVVEMDSVGWLPCRLVPFDGSNPGRPVGPPAAQCTAVGWSPDGAWMYFVSQAGGAFHVWRQRFPDGDPQQLTFGATQEDGISVGSDGSIYTASGIEESSIWLHDAKGERALTNEGYAFLPSMARDKSRVYYLVRGGGSRSYVSGELWSIELATGNKEHLLPGIVMQHYQVSADGKRVLYASGEGGDKSGLYLADLELRHPPKQLTSGGEFRGFFGPPGEILYRANSEPKRLMRMREDGSDQRQMSDQDIWNILSVSPDGEWITFIAGRDENASTMVEALPVNGGDAITLCDTCTAGFGPSRVGSPPVEWRGDGKALFVALKNFGIHSHQTAVFPLKNGTRPQYLVPKNLRSERDFADIPGVTLLPEENAFPGADASMYLASRRTSRSNIYRLRISDK